MNDLATQISASITAAQEWLRQPAMALDQRTPDELLKRPDAVSPSTLSFSSTNIACMYDELIGRLAQSPLPA